jgi:chemotaxis signal transduction protein
MQAGGVALEVDEVEEVLEVELERLLPPPLGTPAGDPLAAVVSEQGSLVAVLDAGTLVQAALQAVPR